MVSTCFFGITSAWKGACLFRSSKATARSSSWSFFAGIFPSAILQKMQSAIVVPSSKQPRGIEQDRHRPVVHQLHLHVGAEAAGRDLHAELARFLAETREERLEI